MSHGQIVLPIVPEPPCEGCELREHCARNSLCCASFRQYLAGAAWPPRAPLPTGTELRAFDERTAA